MRDSPKDHKVNGLMLHTCVRAHTHTHTHTHIHTMAGPWGAGWQNPILGQEHGQEQFSSSRSVPYRALGILSPHLPHRKYPPVHGPWLLPQPW